MHGRDRIRTADRRQLGADVADMAVDRAFRDMDVGLVGIGHHRIAAKHMLRAAKKTFQNRELDRC